MTGPCPIFWSEFRGDTAGSGRLGHRSARSVASAGSLRGRSPEQTDSDRPRTDPERSPTGQDRRAPTRTARGSCRAGSGRDATMGRPAPPAPSEGAPAEWVGRTSGTDCAAGEGDCSSAPLPCPSPWVTYLCRPRDDNCHRPAFKEEGYPLASPESTDGSGPMFRGSPRATPHFPGTARPRSRRCHRRGRRIDSPRRWEYSPCPRCWHSATGTRPSRGTERRT